MARKPKVSADYAAESVNTWGEVIAEAAADLASVTILAEGVRVDGSGHLPVGITVHCSPAKAAELKAAGLAE